MALMLNFVYSQLFKTPPYPIKDHSGETIIVTGANIGLGLEAARHFARLNAARVILAVRTISKGEEAAASITSSTNAKKDVVEVWQLDLSNYASIKAFVAKVNTLDRLDAIVENAGVAMSNKWVVAEGEELTITTNVIGTFLLAVGVLPKLRETGEKFRVLPRLSVVSSEVHFFTNFPQKSAESIFEQLNDEKTEDINDRYNVSKLLEVFFCRELAARTKESGKKGDVVINFLNPGLCHSALSRDGPFLLEVIKFFLARSTEKGSRTLVHAAEAGAETHGQYLSDCQITTPAPLVIGEEGKVLQRRVWEELSGRLEGIWPGVMGNV